MSSKNARRIVFPLLALSLAACGSAADDLPGTYTGRLHTSRQGSRMENLRPNGDSFAADVTHFTGSTTNDGARVEIRAIGERGGNPSFEADLAGICTVAFQYLDGGHLSDNMLGPTCRCETDRGVVEGPALVSGSFSEGRLELTVAVSLPNPEYTGGCTHAFTSMPSP